MYEAKGELGIERKEGVEIYSVKYCGRLGLIPGKRMHIESRKPLAWELNLQVWVAMVADAK